MATNPFLIFLANATKGMAEPQKKQWLAMFQEYAKVSTEAQKAANQPKFAAMAGKSVTTRMATMRAILDSVKGIKTAVPAAPAAGPVTWTSGMNAEQLASFGKFKARYDAAFAKLSAQNKGMVARMMGRYTPGSARLKAMTPAQKLAKMKSFAENTEARLKTPGPTPAPKMAPKTVPFLQFLANATKSMAPAQKNQWLAMFKEYAAASTEQEKAANQPKFAAMVKKPIAVRMSEMKAILASVKPPPMPAPVKDIEIDEEEAIIEETPVPRETYQTMPYFEPTPVIAAPLPTGDGMPMPMVQEEEKIAEEKGFEWGLLIPIVVATIPFILS